MLPLSLVAFLSLSLFLSAFLVVGYAIYREYELRQVEYMPGTLHDTSIATSQVQNGGGVCIGKTGYGLMRAQCGLVYRKMTPKQRQAQRRKAINPVSTPARFVDNLRGPGSENLGKCHALSCVAPSLLGPSKQDLLLCLARPPTSTAHTANQRAGDDEHRKISISIRVASGTSRDDARNRRLDRRSETELLRSSKRRQKAALGLSSASAI